MYNSWRVQTRRIASHQLGDAPFFGELDDVFSERNGQRLQFIDELLVNLHVFGRVFVVRSFEHRLYRIGSSIQRMVHVLKKKKNCIIMYTGLCVQIEILLQYSPVESKDLKQIIRLILYLRKTVKIKKINTKKHTS